MKIKLAVAAAFAAMLPLTMAAKCEAPGTPADAGGKPYTWEVYSYDELGCGCYPSKIDLNDARFHKVETLVLVKWGFTLSDGHVKTKSSAGDPTPWHHTELGPKNPIAIELFAQAADTMSALVCVMYEGEIALGVWVGDGKGQCSASSDVDSI